jgi:predicted nuclease of predicted toxin-antitoxin system
MRLLFDENISYRIVKQLIDIFPESLHVSRIGVSLPISDRIIWEDAKKNDFVIVSFDEDFESFANLYGFPPKVVILRLGNSSTKIIASVLTSKASDIESFYLSDTFGLLEIF